MSEHWAGRPTSARLRNFRRLVLTWISADA